MWTRVKTDLDKQAFGLREEREKVGLFQGKLEIIGAKRDQLVTRAWGAALTLVVLILILTLVARFVGRRSSFS